MNRILNVNAGRSKSVGKNTGGVSTESRPKRAAVGVTAMPGEEEMYGAIVRRDTTYEGVFVVAVKTTGVFCRPGCGARTPRRGNVEFFARAADALHAGYRPCARCRPMESGGSGGGSSSASTSSATPGWVAKVVEIAEKHDGERLRARDLREAGIDPARAARYFKRHYGMTFQAYHRARRLGRALRFVRHGGGASRAAANSGFESQAGFREAFAKVFGTTPGKVDASASVVRVRWLNSPLGNLLAAGADAGVCLLEFVDRRALPTEIAALQRRLRCTVLPGDHAVLDQLEAELAAYFDGRLREFKVRLHTAGTPFQERVWAALREIPVGETRSYAWVARRIGRPTAVRAVARANGDNRLAILIPCHRVIGSDGSLTGYGGGIWRKEWLIAHERGMVKRAGGAAAIADFQSGKIGRL